MQSFPSGFLLDNMIAPRVCAFLFQLLPNCQHVRDAGLLEQPDVSIADYALEHNLTIVKKDTDFYWLSVDRPNSPKVIWVQTGNLTTNQLIHLLENHENMIQEFLRSNRLFLLIRKVG
jgi:predicted nuclease of predicted toxin-antitoxin system